MARAPKTDEQRLEIALDDHADLCASALTHIAQGDVIVADFEIAAGQMVLDHIEHVVERIEKKNEG